MLQVIIRLRIRRIPRTFWSFACSLLLLVWHVYCALVLVPTPKPCDCNDIQNSQQLNKSQRNKCQGPWGGRQGIVTLCWSREVHGRLQQCGTLTCPFSTDEYEADSVLHTSTSTPSAEFLHLEVGGGRQNCGLCSRA